MTENNEHNGTERLRRREYVFFVVFSFLSYLLIIYGFYLYLTERIVTLSVMTPILVAVTIVVALFLLRNLVMTRVEVSLKAKRYEEMLSGFTHTYNVLNGTKEIRLLDKDGDAIIKTSFVCRNADEKLDSVHINISHDGALKIEDVECDFNGITIIPSNVEMQKIINDQTAEPISPMPYRLIFEIRPEKPVLPRQIFAYGYKYKCNKLYPYITEKGKESTIVEILHPNSKLTFIVISPEGYEFDDEKKFSVYDRDGIEHITEMKRIEVANLPYFTSRRKTLIWNIIEPKIADRYKLYFSISPTKKQKNGEQST
jgi:hypothetical protein